MVQVPAAAIVTVAPVTVQTPVVVEAKLTGKPDVAVALTSNGGSPYVLLLISGNVMVWLLRAAADAKIACAAPNRKPAVRINTINL